MTFKILIDKLKSLYSTGLNSDDIGLSNRYLFNLLNTNRNKILKQKKNAKQVISDDSYTILNCIELIQVPSHSCPCLPPLGCKVLRTKFKMPSIVTSNKGPIIAFIKDVLYDENINLFTLSDERTVKSRAGRRYGNKDIDVISNNGYWYFYGDNIPSYIQVKCVLADLSEELIYLNTCDDCEDCNNKCNALETSIYLNSSDIQNLLTLCKVEILQEFKGSVNDIQNNNKDDI